MKALASKRLMTARTLFRQVTTEMFAYVMELWQRHTDQFLAASQTALSTPAQLAAVVSILEQARLALKLLRLFLSHGCPDFHLLPVVVQFVPALVARHKAMIELRCSVPDGHRIADEMNKYVVLCNKVYVDAQAKEPLSFVQLMEPIMTLAIEQILNGKKADKTKTPLERSLVLFMVLMVEILKCPRFVCVGLFELMLALCPARVLERM